jgi:hypothetical protein
MSDDSFDFKSFIVDIILSSLEKMFRFFALINIEVTDIVRGQHRASHMSVM